MARHRETSSTSDPITLTDTVYKVDYDVDDKCVLQEGVVIANSSTQRTHIVDTIVKKMDDVVTPDFKKRLKSGEIINNPLSKTISISHLPVTYCETSGTKILDCNGPYVSLTDDRTYQRHIADYIAMEPADFGHFDEVESIEAQAVTNAYANVSASSTNVLASLGELSETASSLVSIFLDAKKIILALAKDDYRSLIGELTPKKLAERYMEARYAIRPLCYDVIQTCNAIEAICNKVSHKRFTFYGRASDTFSSVEPISYQDTWTDALYNRSVYTSISSRAGVLVHIDKITPPMILGITDVVEAAWELTPFSFIIDWFFNVGKTLSSWSPNIGITELTSWVTTKTYVKVQGNVIRRDPTDWYSKNSWNHTRTGYSGIEGYKILESTVRTPNPSRAILPTLDINLDFFKLLDLAIIMKGFF